MIRRRLFLAAAIAIVAAALPQRSGAADGASPTATISSFYDTLLGVMKEGPALGFKGRYDRLDPVIHRVFDLPLMTRLMVGPRWSSLTPTQQQQLINAFGDFSVATYARRFDEYAGEHFQVDPNTTPTTNGAIVHSRLVRTDGDPVELDYLVRDANRNWQIVDVYLSGTVSELATRRSEFSSVLRRDGPDALVDLLQKKVAQLRS